MQFLSKRATHRTLLGVDINSNAICITALTRDKQSFSIETCARTSLPADKSNSEHILSTLQQTLATANTRIKSAVIAIEYSAALFKVIEVDASLTAAEILSHLKSRISQFFNQPPEELLLDFENLGPSQNHPELMLIRWIAAKKQPVFHFIENLKKLGLTTVAVDINAYALQRAVNHFLGQPIVNSAATTPTLATLYMNGESILLTVSNHQTPVYTLAEQNKSLSQKDSDLTGILTFIARALQLYYNSESHKPVDRLALCGHIPDTNIIASIEHHTHIPTQLVVPFDYLKFKNTEKIPHATSEFMLSIGLAMHTGNFLV